MALDFSSIEKNYVLLINHPDLLNRAKELGYENAILFTQALFRDISCSYHLVSATASLFCTHLIL